MKYEEIISPNFFFHIIFKKPDVTLDFSSNSNNYFEVSYPIKN